MAAKEIDYVLHFAYLLDYVYAVCLQNKINGVTEPPLPRPFVLKNC